MDFDHNHKNSWNMLMGRVLMTLTGVMFSILTIRTLWLHTDNDDSQLLQVLDGAARCAEEQDAERARKDGTSGCPAHTVRIVAVQTDRHRPARVWSRVATLACSSLREDSRTTKVQQYKLTLNKPRLCPSLAYFIIIHSISYLFATSRLVFLAEDK